MPKIGKGDPLGFLNNYSVAKKFFKKGGPFGDFSKFWGKRLIVLKKIERGTLWGH